jgi:tRNA threonylcarbamoyladenosine biosynthesis protein TsaB
MPTLALDTTTRAGSAALVAGGRVSAERRGDAARSHGERLPGELTALLDVCGTRLDAVDLYAVAAGPGSFTGLRIGIATMQGLAFVTGRPIVAVSALDALAHAVSASRPPGAIVGAWMDAQRGDVFSALYRVTDGAPFTPERLIPVEDAAVGAPADTAARWLARPETAPVVVVGDGAVRYRDAFAGSGTAVVDAPPLAGAIGLLAETLAARGAAAAPFAVRPLYVRRPDALLARESGTGHGARGTGHRAPGTGD